MLITSVQVFLGWPGLQPPVGLSFWTFFDQPSPCSTCHLSWQVWSTIKLHPLQKILHADLVLGGDATHPAAHSSVIVLQAMQSRWGWGPGFASMKHGATDARIVNSFSGGDREVRTGRSSLNLPHATRYLVMEMRSRLPPEDKKSLS